MMTEAERDWPMPDWVQVGETFYVRVGKTVTALERGEAKPKVGYRTFEHAIQAQRFLTDKLDEQQAHGFILARSK